jgi:hypothetical protein
MSNITLRFFKMDLMDNDQLPGSEQIAGLLSPIISIALTMSDWGQAGFGTQVAFTYARVSPLY